LATEPIKFVEPNIFANLGVAAQKLVEIADASREEPDPCALGS